MSQSVDDQTHSTEDRYIFSNVSLKMLQKKSCENDTCVKNSKTILDPYKIRIGTYAKICCKLLTSQGLLASHKCM